jgi:hypothetical protein
LKQSEMRIHLTLFFALLRSSLLFFALLCSSSLVRQIVGGASNRVSVHLAPFGQYFCFPLYH